VGDRAVIGTRAVCLLVCKLFELQVIKPRLSKCRVISSHKRTVVTEWEMFACVMKRGRVRVHTGDLFILANQAEPSCDLNRIPCST